MSKLHKLRLLKDLPEYPKDCVFILGENGWRAYWDGGDFAIPKWLEELLYGNVPEPSDEMTDWFEPIKDEESTVYEVNIRGEVKERQIYNFWVNTESVSTFETREEAESVAKQIKQIFAQPPQPIDRIKE
jgi:hypothetical protein